jgi:hypothetical protein
MPKATEEEKAEWVENGRRIMIDGQIKKCDDNDLVGLVPEDAVSVKAAEAKTILQNA